MRPRTGIAGDPSSTGVPTVTFVTNWLRLRRDVRLLSGGILASASSWGLGLWPTEAWQIWHVDFTICSPTRKAGSTTGTCCFSAPGMPASCRRYANSERTSASVRLGLGEGISVPPLCRRSSSMSLACLASGTASFEVTSIPTFFMRSIYMLTDVARTGSMTELISGGAPVPDVPWQPWHLKRDRSEPYRVVLCPVNLLESCNAGSGSGHSLGIG